MNPSNPRSKPHLRCFPRADRAFATEVARLVDELPDAAAPDAPAQLEALIRRRYSSARVSPQDPLASFGDVGHVWYVYRRDAPAAEAPDGEAADPSASVGGGRDSAPSNDVADPAAPDATTTGDEVAPSEPSGAGHGSRPVYSVAATAAMVGVPVSILVGWDDAGLVKPGTTPSGARLYSRDNLEDLMQVKRDITAGRTVEEARDTVSGSRERRKGGPFGGAGRGRRLIVLLAERDPYAAEMAEYFLRTEGYDVDVAFSVQEAESQAGQRVPDVSIVDLLISGGAGAELCARLKAAAGTQVLAISTLESEDVALRSGADAFLTKPLDPLQLISTIKDLLGESAMLRQRAAT